MQITLDTDNLSPLDYDVLRLVVGDQRSVEIDLDAAAAAGKATAKKAAAAPKAEAAPAAEPTPPEPTPAPDSAEDQMAAAVTLAQGLVVDGKARVVKHVLDEIGRERVGHLEPAELGTFIDALSELGVKQIEAKLDADLAT